MPTYLVASWKLNIRRWKLVIPMLTIFFSPSFIPHHAMSQDLELTPLPACPDTPNCVLQDHKFNKSPSELADHAVAVLKAMDAESIDIGQVDHHEIKAVFKACKFRDDVHIAMLPEQHGTRLFIRSASREGYYDLGVNKRRVKRFLRRLNSAIESVN